MPSDAIAAARLNRRRRGIRIRRSSPAPRRLRAGNAPVEPNGPTGRQPQRCRATGHDNYMWPVAQFWTRRAHN
eukprot:2765736-Alexandrium_andersonii.AAC.1